MYLNVPSESDANKILFVVKLMTEISASIPALALGLATACKQAVGKVIGKTTLLPLEPAETDPLPHCMIRPFLQCLQYRHFI